MCGGRAQRERKRQPRGRRSASDHASARPARRARCAHRRPTPGAPQAHTQATPPPAPPPGRLRRRRAVRRARVAQHSPSNLRARADGMPRSAPGVCALGLVQRSRSVCSGAGGRACTWCCSSPSSTAAALQSAATRDAIATGPACGRTGLLRARSRSPRSAPRVCSVAGGRGRHLVAAARAARAQRCSDARHVGHHPRCGARQRVFMARWLRAARAGTGRKNVPTQGGDASTCRGTVNAAAAVRARTPTGFSATGRVLRCSRQSRSARGSAGTLHR